MTENPAPPMKARLYCPTGKHRGRSISLAGETVIGRSGGPTAASAQIPDDRVSARHARVIWVAEDRSWYLEDLGSTNGTTVAGRPLRGRERLSPLDVVNFGGAGDFLLIPLREEPEAASVTISETVIEAWAGEDRTTFQSAPPRLPTLRPDAGDRTEPDWSPPASTPRPADEEKQS